MYKAANGSTNSPVLIANSLEKQYNGRRILTSADITLNSGRITALLGRTGSGKSTFLEICAGLTSADSGSLSYFGEPIPRPRYSELAMMGIYIIPLNGAEIPSRSLRQHLRDVQKSYGAKEFDSKDTGDVIRTLGLESMLDSPLRSLSGGQRKLANIAIAAVRDPAILLIDEPFRNLDPLVVQQLGELLRKMAQEGCSILMAGQDPQNMLHYADDVSWLVAGRIHGLGSPSEAMEHERFRTEYLVGR